MQLGKEVALKTFSSRDLDSKFLQRFQREAQAIGRLSHPNIVQVFDFGVGEDNVPYYTMECLEGESLAERLASKKSLSLDQAVNLFIEVCNGMSAAHNKGIIHRDLKPGNIFLKRDSTSAKDNPTAKIVDFGLSGWASHSIEGQKLTSTGTIFGSPLYMSPEQSLGLEVTEATDIYSCGCAFFETLTGSPPYMGETAFATMLLHQSSPIPQIRDRPGEQILPDRLKGLIERMLAKNPQKRVSSFATVNAELQAILNQLRTVSTETRSLEPDSEDIEEPKDKGGLLRYLPLTGLVLVCCGLIAGGYYFLQHVNETKTVSAQKSQSDTTKIAKATAQSAPVVVLQPGSSGKQDSQWPVLKGQESNDTVPPQKFLLPAGKDHPGERHFCFRRDISLGTLSWVPTSDSNFSLDREVVKSAQGDVFVPKDCLLGYTPNKFVADHPGYLTGFAPNDLDRLTLHREDGWYDNQLNFICSLTGLRYLSMDSLNIIEDKSLLQVNRLNALETLSIRNVDVDGSTVTKLNRLQKLHSLVLDGMVNVTAVLNKLKGSSNISYLILKSCDLKNADLQVLASMPNLHELYLTNNYDLTDGCLITLNKLPQLKELYLEGTQVTQAAIDRLKNLKNLKVLQLNIKFWSEEKRAELHNLLPECNIRLCH